MTQENRNNNIEEITINDDEDIEEVYRNFVAKDGTKWNRTPTTDYQTPPCNISIDQSGPHESTATLSIRDTFKCIFSDEMIDMIIRHTNTKAKQEYHENRAEKQQWQDLTVREIETFLGILITSGVNNSKLDDEQTMWKSNSYPLYRASMNKTRFIDILHFIAFDDANTRVRRIAKYDILEPIHDLWNMLHSNLQKYYRPTKNLTIGKQLVPNINDLPQYEHIDSTKIWWVCDAKNYYPLFGKFEIVTGEIPIQKIYQDGRIIKELIASYKGSGRNITMDFFTTLPLARDLLSWNLTIVGALNGDEICIPQEMTSSNLDKRSFAVFQKNVTLCSHMPEKGRTLMLLSTMSNNITSEQEEIDKIVDFYNKTKFGDKMHKMIKKYSTFRRTDNWFVTFFYNILDIAAFAAYIIYMENNSMKVDMEEEANKPDTRRIFLRKLGEELCMPMIQDRSQDPQIIRDFSSKTGIECMLQRSVNVIDKTSLISTSITSSK